MSALTRLGDLVRTQLAGRVLWTRELGVGRTLLAVSTFGTLLATPNRLLLRDPTVFWGGPVCTGFGRASVFCVFGSANAGLGRNFALLILLVVAYGWRPQITCIPHWWVSWSLFVTSITADGGDQAAAILTLLLIPVGLTDRRTWHWNDAPMASADTVGLSHSIAASAMCAVQIQVAVIYLHAGIAKFGQHDWANGTAAYYWLLDPRFGAAFVFRAPLRAVLGSGIGVSVATYAVVLIELATAFAWAARGRLRWVIFSAAVGLHAAIALFMGLPSFGVAMAGALVLYLFANEGRAGVGRSIRAPAPGPRSRPTMTTPSAEGAPGGV